MIENAENANISLLSKFLRTSCQSVAVITHPINTRHTEHAQPSTAHPSARTWRHTTESNASASQLLDHS